MAPVGPLSGRCPRIGGWNASVARSIRSTSVGSPDQRDTMTKRVGALGACGALAVALLLSGCTQPSTPAHTVAAAVAPVPTPTPTPVETYPTCASMVPAATINSIDPKLVLQPSRDYSIAPPSAGAAPNTRAEFMTAVYPPSSTTVLAGLQAGYFTCAWIGCSEVLSERRGAPVRVRRVRRLQKHAEIRHRILRRTRRRRPVLRRMQER